MYAQSDILLHLGPGRELVAQPVIQLPPPWRVRSVGAWRLWIIDSSTGKLDGDVENGTFIPIVVSATLNFASWWVFIPFAFHL
jgi:hypothetical protein